MDRKRIDLLLRIIELSETVEKGLLDPFKVDVKKFFNQLSEILPQLKSLEELNIDMEAVRKLVNVIFHQKKWFIDKSSLLYFDPIMIQWKIQVLNLRGLAEILVDAWHPIIEHHQLIPQRLMQSLEYWEKLEGKPKEELSSFLEGQPGKINFETLREMGFISQEEFESGLKRLREELLEKTSGKEIDYWDFIVEETFQETIRRAYLTAFLCEYGYASIRFSPLEEKFYVKPTLKRKGREGESHSLPISISIDVWREKTANARQGKKS